MIIRQRLIFLPWQSLRCGRIEKKEQGSWKIKLFKFRTSPYNTSFAIPISHRRDFSQSIPAISFPQEASRARTRFSRAFAFYDSDQIKRLAAARANCRFIQTTQAPCKGNARPAILIASYAVFLCRDLHAPKEVDRLVRPSVVLEK